MHRCFHPNNGSFRYELVLPVFLQRELDFLKLLSHHAGKLALQFVIKCHDKHAYSQVALCAYGILVVFSFGESCPINMKEPGKLLRTHLCIFA